MAIVKSRDDKAITESKKIVISNSSLCCEYTG